MGKGPKKGKGKDDEASPYKDTVRLPQTSFDLRANSKVREPELQRWCAPAGPARAAWAQKAV